MARQTKLVTSLTLTALYVLTRFAHFSRELTSEEGVFLMPGRFLFEGLGYHLNFGEHLGAFDFLNNPFHKPQLTSLLLGAFSFLSPDLIMGARMAPFAVGWLVCLFPFWVTGSVLPSALILISPFLYAAASQMQTDPVSGLLGYSLLSAGCIFWWNHRDEYSFRWIAAGLLTLWLGKLELAIASTSALIVFFPVVLPRADRIPFIKKIVALSLIGVLSFLGMSWILGLTSGYSFSQSALHVFLEMKRISLMQLSQASSQQIGMNAGRTQLIERMNAYRGWWLLFLFYAPTIWIFFKLQSKKAQGVLLPLFGISIAPIVGYLMGSWAGDSFPRYFLTAFPPASVALGYQLSRLPRRRWVSSIIMVIAILTQVPMLGRLMGVKGSVTSQLGFIGYEDAAAIVRSVTHAGDRIVAYEPMMMYLRDRKVFVSESYEPYADQHQKVYSFADSIDAIVMYRPNAVPLEHRYGGPTGQLLKALEKNPHSSIRSGVFEITYKLRK